MYVTHYTIDKNHGTIEEHETGKPTIKHRYIPGHSLGGGWTRHIVELAEGDTADNPASTKGPIYGPAFIVYDCHKTGITVHVHDGASEFYDALKCCLPSEFEKAKEIVRGQINKNEGFEDPIDETMGRVLEALSIPYDPATGGVKKQTTKEAA